MWLRVGALVGERTCSPAEVGKAPYRNRVEAERSWKQRGRQQIPRIWDLTDVVSNPSSIAA